MLSNPRLSFKSLTMALLHSIYASAQFTITENIDTTVFFGLSSSKPIFTRFTSSPSAQYDCDGHGIFACPTGTCYTGAGYVGCCTASSCLPRTTCLEFNPMSSASCDPSTGGCLACSNAAAPACVTISNPIASQYSLYCGPTRTLILTPYANIFVTTTTSLLSALPIGPTTSSPAATEITLAASPATTPSPTPATAVLAHTTLPTASTIGIALGALVAVAAVFAILLFLLVRRRRRTLFSETPYTIMRPSDDMTDRDSPTELDPTEKLSPELPASPSSTATPIGLGISELIGSSPISVKPRGTNATVNGTPENALVPSPLFSASRNWRHLSMTPSRPISPPTPQPPRSLHFASRAADSEFGTRQSRSAVAAADTGTGFLSAEEAMRNGYRENVSSTSTSEAVAVAVDNEFITNSSPGVS